MLKFNLCFQKNVLKNLCYLSICHYYPERRRGGGCQGNAAGRGNTYTHFPPQYTYTNTQRGKVKATHTHTFPAHTLFLTHTQYTYTLHIHTVGKSRGNTYTQWGKVGTALRNGDDDCDPHAHDHSLEYAMRVIVIWNRKLR